MTLLLLASLPIVMSFIWELRAFCRYLCPVASYIASYSVVGRLMVRKRDAEVCRKCKERSCLTGNANGWACPYGLCVATIERNVDCGICTECFKSCPFNNVSLAWRRMSWDDRFSSYGEAWQAVVLLVLSMVYSLTVHSPWPIMRDMVNVVDKATWPEFGLYALALWTLALGIAPLIFWLATGMGICLIKAKGIDSGQSIPGHSDEYPGLLDITTGAVSKRTMPCLIPLGLSLWAVFFVDTIMVNFTFILLTLSDPFGWGWDLFGTSGKPWVQLWPSGIPWIQAGITLTGLALSLKKGYQMWWKVTRRERTALKGFLPTAVILIAFAAGMLVYFTNY